MWARRHRWVVEVVGKEDGSLLGEEFELDWVQGPALTPVPEEEEEEEEGAPFRTPRDPGDGCLTRHPPRNPPTHLRPGTTSQPLTPVPWPPLAGLLCSGVPWWPLVSTITAAPIAGGPGWGGLQAALLALAGARAWGPPTYFLYSSAPAPQSVPTPGLHRVLHWGPSSSELAPRPPGRPFWALGLPGLALGQAWLYPLGSSGGRGKWVQ